MSTIYMITAPRSKLHKREIKKMIEDYDIHKWIVAKEKGKGGYEHWQIRIQTSASFEQLKARMPQAHIEKASDTWEYERKEGNYWTSQDTTDIRSCRFGKTNCHQKYILERTRSGGNRTITCVYDTKGSLGKSWLCRHLYERGKAYYVPPTIDSPKAIIQFVASGYRGEEIIVIDIPRSWRWTEAVYTAIESIKDGLVYDTRYNARMRDIWGVKVLVMCNTKPQLDKLSTDRWDIIEVMTTKITLKN